MELLLQQVQATKEMKCHLHYVYGWHKRLKKSRDDFEHNAKSGRTSTRKFELARKLIGGNRQLTVPIIADELSIYRESV